MKPELPSAPIPRARPDPPKRVTERMAARTPPPQQPDPPKDPLDFLNKLDKQLPTNQPRSDNQGGGNGRPLTQADVRGFFAKVRSRLLRISPQAGEEHLTAVVRFFLNRDGTLAGPPERDPAAPAPVSARHALWYERAKKAIIEAQPYTTLPPDKYDRWKKVILTFPMSGDELRLQ